MFEKQKDILGRPFLASGRRGLFSGPKYGNFPVPAKPPHGAPRETPQGVNS
jgi:hypothetical protein